MNVPSHFAMTEDDVRDLLAEHGAGDLVTFSPDKGTRGHQAPARARPEPDGWGSLHGHLARVNDQWKAEVTGKALVIVRGRCLHPPGWYPSKRDHGRVGSCALPRRRWG